MPTPFRALPLLLLAACLALAGCAQKKVRVPPRLDLQSIGSVGVYRFSCNKTKRLGHLATQRFIEYVQSAQPGTPVVELGAKRGRTVPEDLEGLKRSRGLQAVFTGRVDLSRVRPGDVSALEGSLSVEAAIEGQMSVKLYRTRDGATLWTRSASARAPVAQVGLSEDGGVSFGANAPEEARGKLVRELCLEITRDFRPRYVRAR